VKDEILSYIDMCQRERISLQKGMNCDESGAPTIVLMSRRQNAPYQDALSEDGTELTYEGHDIPRTVGVDPKRVDQPRATSRGTLTENGKFAQAIDRSTRFPRVRVYEKLKPGIWSDKGRFDLFRYEYLTSGERKVFRFHMRLSPDQEDEVSIPRAADTPMRRIIPGWVKQEVYRRDNGQCVICQARDHLHFDHDLPYSRGGAGITPENVRILCARHNLSKGARIE
jgi:hypothetical protein